MDRVLGNPYTPLALTMEMGRACDLLVQATTIRRLADSVGRYGHEDPPLPR
jgi:hypothetical protein